MHETSPPGAQPNSTFPSPEEPLRQTILKAHNDYWGHAGKPRQVLGAVRQFLSGAPCGESVLERYWFEEDPPRAALAFAEDLDRSVPGLARATLEPLVSTARQAIARRSRELAPNTAVYLAGLSGPIALRTQLDEALIASVLAALTLALGRIGVAPLEAALQTAAPRPTP